jgi:ABC-type tungstate transport system substrate-binding protein
MNGTTDPAVRQVVAACADRVQFEATTAVNAEFGRLVSEGHDQSVVVAGTISALSATLYSAISALVADQHQIAVLGDCVSQMAKAMATSRLGGNGTLQ